MSVFKLINIVLIIINAIIFIAPKKEMNNLNASGAGILALFALIAIAVFAVHLILTAVALWFNKIIMLQVMAVLMVPASMVLWYFAFYMIKF